MPIIDHSTQRLVATGDFTSERPLVTKEHGAVLLTIRELVMEPGASSRWCTHPTDVAIMVQEGSIQMAVGTLVVCLGGSARAISHHVTGHGRGGPGGAADPAV